MNRHAIGRPVHERSAGKGNRRVVSKEVSLSATTARAARGGGATGRWSGAQVPGYVVCVSLVRYSFHRRKDIGGL